MSREFRSAEEVRSLIISGESSARQETEFVLQRIQDIDQSGYELNSILAVNANATSEATAIDEQNLQRPLEGIPVVVKDNVEARGLPATAGSLALAGRPVVKDSTVVARLRAAGAVIVAATNLSEWANIRSSGSTSGWSGVAGLTANPWIRQHNTGGSSSGSGAAIAAGLAPLAIGSETDGSIISPASKNGCVGIKPTVGAIPRDGIIPISKSQDSPGPMARNVRDAALMLEVLLDKAGFLVATEANDLVSIGVVRSWMTKDEDTNACFESVISSLSKAGMKISIIDLPDPSEDISQDEFSVLLHELSEDLGEYLRGRAGVGVQSLQDVVDFNNQHSDLELQYFGQDLFDTALTLGGRTGDYFEIRKRNLRWAEETLSKGFADVDVLIGATYAPAPLSRLGHGDDYSNASWFTMAPAIAGTPVGSLPMELVNGLPVGIGIASRKHDELNLVRAMAQIERIIGLGTLIPTFRK